LIGLQDIPLFKRDNIPRVDVGDAGINNKNNHLYGKWHAVFYVRYISLKISS